MGELKSKTEGQPKLLARLKNTRHQVYLANLGLRSKVKEGSKKQLDRLIAAGEKARGEQVAATIKPALAIFGLAEVLKEEAQKLKGDSLKTQIKEVRQQFATLHLKAEASKLFDELVAAGEKRQAH